MRVVAENERLAPPSLCFICEQSPIRDQALGNVVDTQRDFNPPALSHLSGRKYICERCADEAARLLGYVKEAEIDAAQVALTKARQDVEALVTYVQSLSTAIGERVTDVLSVFPAPTFNTVQRDKNTVDTKEKPKDGKA